MPASSRFCSASSPTFGMSRVISSWPSLVSRAITSNSSMWIEVKTSSRDDALGDQDRVLEVVAVPRHERDEHVAAERQLAELGRRAVGDDVALGHPVADLHQRPLVDAGVLVRALELQQVVDVDARRPRRRRRSPAPRCGWRRPGRRRRRGGRRWSTPESRATVAFHAGADQRRVGADQRHRLALHVRAHQRAVGVVVLEERDQRRGHRDELLRRDVDQRRSSSGRDQTEVAALAARHQVAGEAALARRARHSAWAIV